ncbi:T9SS type A sorting domain-containing protein [Chryseobacterium sp. DT-3]|uniref:T9SS type A sorting domain-containing protein n=1 Tax=Chryseobacterium sp. DT-3 TaxID=3396164 RepID=UPI003F19B040
MKKIFLFLCFSIMSVDAQYSVSQDPSAAEVYVTTGNELHSYAMSDNGSIYFYGDSQGTGITKYLPNGNIDLQFGNNGRLIPAQNNDIRYPIIVKGNNFYLLDIFPKQFPNYTINYLRLGKYDLNGQLITSFGENGFFTAPPMGQLQYFSVSNYDNAIYISKKDTGVAPEKLIRINADGNIDNVFGEKNFSTIDSSNLLFTNDNGILVVQKESTSASTLKVTKFFQNGNLDFSFGNQGVINIPGNNVKNVYVNALNEFFYLATNDLTKYTSLGIIDTTFGNNGTVSIINFNPPQTYTYSIYQMGFDSLNKMLLFGSAKKPNFNNYFSYNFFISRLNIDGSYDNSSNDGLSFYIGGYPSSTQYHYLLSVSGKVLNDNEYYLQRKISFQSSSNTKMNMFNKFIRKNSVLAVEDYEKNNFQIYPNPVSDILNIEFASNEKIQEINIYSTDGKLALTGNESKINLQTLLPGNYIAKIKTSKNEYTKKIIKN